MITEGHDALLADLDLRSTAEVVRAVNEANGVVLEVLREAEGVLAALVDAVAPLTGRVIYVGAGSAGAMAAADAAEWGPTFGLPDDAVVALVAGGRLPAGPERESAEDDAQAGAAELRALTPTVDDVVVAVSASGATPYAVAALEVARGAGALTAAIVCVPHAALADLADHAVVLPVGPEVIAGSTRLKAGTAQKLVLNAFSTAVMVRRGRTYGDLMTSMRVANAKLRDRAARLCVAATGCSEEAASSALADAGDDVAVAVVMLARATDAATARALLEATGGNVRGALET